VSKVEVLIFEHVELFVEQGNEFGGLSFQKVLIFLSLFELLENV
jgi:hypothetical protein